VKKGEQIDVEPIKTTADRVVIVFLVSIPNTGF
jgi:hypothetical protein